MSQQMHLNLARKWRPRTFDEVVGQEMSVRILKNSLYLGRYFPLYLFSGQRGSGKTTLARIFAAAINCEQLGSFRENPKQATFPCLNCTSCRAIESGTHSDFVEMDAASHTGVDNVRAIIESAGLLPVMSSKRIYLIDEAHMLSRAAFNAFLKLLEEPPTHVHFLMATTDPHKIIDTVKSRAFQLLFAPLQQNELAQHLEMICQKEEVEYERSALLFIAQESQGSARDALNLLDQARLAHPIISQSIVQQLLGYPDQTTLSSLFEKIITQNRDDLLVFLKETALIQAKNVMIVWKELTRYINSLVEKTVQHSDHTNISLARCMHMLEIVYKYEPLILKTSEPVPLLHLILIKLCESSQNRPSSANTAPVTTQRASKTPEHINSPLVSTPVQSEPAKITVNNNNKNIHHASWPTFLAEIAMLDDPLVQSIFKQAMTSSFDSQTNKLTLSFSKNQSFFSELLASSSTAWMPVLKKVFGDTVCLISSFGEESENARVSITSERNEISTPQATGTVPSLRNTTSLPKETFFKRSGIHQASARRKPEEQPLDVSDKTKWQKANQLLEIFPGTISIVAQFTKD